MRLKLIDVKDNPHEAETGTCELCFGTMYVTEPTFIFQRLDTRETEEVNGFYWNWEDYTEVDDIDNVIDFASFINTKNFEEKQELNFGWLDNLINEYHDSKKVH